MFAGFFGGWEIVVIVAAILVLFGAKRIPEFAKGLGQGIREFKKASREVTDEISRAGEDTPQTPKTPPANTTPQSQPPAAPGPETKVV